MHKTFRLLKLLLITCNLQWKPQWEIFENAFCSYLTYYKIAGPNRSWTGIGCRQTQLCGAIDDASEMSKCKAATFCVGGEAAGARVNAGIGAGVGAGVVMVGHGRQIG